MERSAKGDETRERIIEAALPLFASGGYSGTSVRTLASAAECNVATIAYHFGGKEGLYDAVVRRLYEDLLSGWPAAAPPGLPSGILRYYVDVGFGFLRDHRVHVRLLQRHWLDAGRHPGVVTDEFAEPLLERAEAILAAFRPDWSRADRRMLIFSAQHLCVRLVLEDPALMARYLDVPEVKGGEVEAYLTRWIERQLGV